MDQLSGDEGPGDVLSDIDRQTLGDAGAHEAAPTDPRGRLGSGAGEAASADPRGRLGSGAGEAASVCRRRLGSSAGDVPALCC